MRDFKLSASLKGHEDDVRDLAFATPTDLISASRDATVRRWRLKSSNPPLYDDTIVSHGSAFINAITYFRPTPAFPEGLIVSGGKDTIIEVRKPSQPPDADAERLFLGHQGNVCALDCPDTEARYVVSGSWDSSAMVWDVSKGEPTATLEGHSGSVWAVLAYDDTRIMTGCADHLVRVFSVDGMLLQTLKGSTDVVRALCKLPTSNPYGAHFASAGNDAVIRLWTIDGKQVAQLSGHDNFIYSLAALPSGEIVSSGEDRTVRVWRESQCIQTITHPAISVWTVAACAESGDIVSGASDRIARVFSRSPERHADKEAIEAFDEAVRGSSIPKQSVGNGDINKEQLPGPDFLKKKAGTKEGQVQMIREPNGNVTAHTWSHLAQQWVNVGTVVDAAGSSGRRQEYMGQDYDYVFDVDIAEGEPPLKLPYNQSQNPFEVARKFVADHELPLSYLDQVVNFIVTNTQGTNIGQQAGSTDSRPATQARPKVLPQTDYLTITTANFGIISRKTQELNSQLLSDGRKDIAFSPSDLKIIPNFIQELESALVKPASSSTLDIGADLITKIITAWPAPMRIPGLDLYRCLAAAHPGLTTRQDVLETLKESGAFPQFASDVPSNPNMTMLGIRAIANLFNTREGRSYIGSHREKAHELVAPCIQPTSGVANRNVYIAATTFYINFAVYLSTEAADDTQAGATAQVLLKHLTGLLDNAKVVDSETVYRALVATGTLVKIPGAKDENAEQLEAAITAAGKRCKEPRIRGIIEEIMPPV